MQFKEISLFFYLLPILESVLYIKYLVPSSEKCMQFGQLHLFHSIDEKCNNKKNKQKNNFVSLCVTSLLLSDQLVTESEDK